MNKPYIIGITVGLSCFFLFVILIWILIAKLNKRNKKDRNLIKQFDIDIKDELINLSNSLIPNSTIIRENKYYISPKISFELKNVLITSVGLFVMSHVYQDGGIIEGDTLEREWNIKMDKKNILFPNPVVAIDNTVKALGKIMPSNIPLICVLVFKNGTKPNLYNLPGYVLASEVNNLAASIYEVYQELPQLLSNEQMGNIVNIFWKFQSKKI
ncbi:hypothetical protein [Metamycoplasma neophronis]|uniref:NERD domain-containing protein n=1 Tax=Metamycoplasma neophronis TaxID=872983 RepID=A0ABY2Z4B6_9BACT|nr:hypothetical protein [Metamycoplasma neophronis]TPR53717.1 hypothetical protein FJR74_02340 [Metamycoplasma neophronis]